MNYEELEKRVANLIFEIEEVSELINDCEADFENDGVYFKQAKEVENTISNLQKLNIPIPEELTKLKLSLVNKKNNLEIIKRIRNKFEQGSEYFNHKKITESNGKNNYIPSEFTGKNLVSVIIFNKEYIVNFWKDIVILVSELIYELHNNDFENILKIKGKKRKYFSKEQNELRKPNKIKNTDIFCETNLSAKDCIRISKEVLKEFGHKPEELEVKYED